MRIFQSYNVHFNNCESNWSILLYGSRFNIVSSLTGFKKKKKSFANLSVINFGEKKNYNESPVKEKIK